jgi:hypothetical protein
VAGECDDDEDDGGCWWWQSEAGKPEKWKAPQWEVLAVGGALLRWQQGVGAPPLCCAPLSSRGLSSPPPPPPEEPYLYRYPRHSPRCRLVALAASLLPVAGTNCHQPSLFGLTVTSLPQRRRRENHSPGATPLSPFYL